VTRSLLALLLWCFLAFGMVTELKVRLRRPHPAQRRFIRSKAKRKILRAGRRGGKTTGIAILAVEEFLKGRRVLYAAPTGDQVEKFWFECKKALAEPIDAGVYKVNETRHTIEVEGTEHRIRCKTAWNADTLRGDYADLLILDEFQLMDEDTWAVVGAPMLLDNNGDAVFIYTPPSLRSRSTTKARDPQHAAKLFKRVNAGDLGTSWETFHFRSADNPYISQDALEELAKDMTSIAYRQEILAEDLDEPPGALWTYLLLEALRVQRAPDLSRIVVAVDPSGTSTAMSDEVGIVVAGVGQCNCQGLKDLIGRDIYEEHGFVLKDVSGIFSPQQWAQQVVKAFTDANADRVVAEVNFGGEMVRAVLNTVNRSLPFKAVSASRGKVARAEPVAALYEQHKVHHVGEFTLMEGQMVNFVPGMAFKKSPDRADALVWALTDLMLPSGGSTRIAPAWEEPPRPRVR